MPYEISSLQCSRLFVQSKNNRQQHCESRGNTANHLNHLFEETTQKTTLNCDEELSLEIVSGTGRKERRRKWNVELEKEEKTF